MTQRRRKDWIKIAAWMWILLACFAGNAPSFQKERTNEPGPMVSKIIVDVQGIRGDVSPWADLAKNLIFIEEGELFSCFVHHLDGDVAPQTLIVGQVNAAHSAGAQQVQQQKSTEAGRNRLLMPTVRATHNGK